MDETKKETQRPLVLIIEEAKAELISNVMLLQQKYKIPASLLDTLLTSALAEVREMKVQELIMALEGGE